MTKSNRKELFKAANLIEAFRGVSPELPSQMAAAFLIICRNEGCSVKDVGDRLGLAKSSASRNISALSEVHRKGTPGFNLVETYDDPMDRRVKKINLTQKGKALRNRIIELMED